MSLVTDSPVHSSSSDDFATFLDASLDSDSSEEAKDPNHLETQRTKRCKVETMENVEEGSESTSLAPSLEEASESTSLAPSLEEASESTSLASSLEQTVEASIKKDACSHPGSFGEMCILCGQRLDDKFGVTFGYIHKGLRLQNNEIVRLQNTDMKNLLSHKKLCLVLDLDHTLLNSTLLMHMTSEEEYLKSQTDSLQDVSKGSLYMLDFMHMMTKLRPFVRTFLNEASEMFEMYIYTMGDRPYALEMAKLLDPQREYFSSRVISRDDGTHKHQKGLDIVLGQESAALILDDTENAWPKHKENLILMERYHFFASSCHQFGFSCKSLSELKHDESETDGALATVLKVLKRVHKMFFDEFEETLVDRDVRQVLKLIKKEVLKGCKLVFSRVLPTRFQAENHHLWKLAEDLGATCSTELDPSVTHVVSTDAGTEKSHWAVKHMKFLVHPRWIEAANYMWQKQPEEKYTVNQTKNQ